VGIVMISKPNDTEKKVKKYTGSKQNRECTCDLPNHGPSDQTLYGDHFQQRWAAWLHLGASTPGGERIVFRIIQDDVPYGD
jgi:hypothetical protein